jgi:pSer/pThr/pTyr-binding forkhead associated (FHA) protein
MGVQLVVRSSEGGEGATFAYSFEQERVLFGRGAGSDVRIPHRSVSVEHAVLRQQGTRWVVEDKGSTNGTWVKGTRIPAGRPKLVEPGDEIRVGAYVVQFHTRLARDEATSREGTAELARRMVRELWASESPNAGARLVVVSGPDAGSELVIPQAPSHTVLGRSEEATLQITDADCSREHLALLADADGVVARDLGSKNGTTVGGKALTERRLRHRDEIVIGATTLVFEEPAAAFIDSVVSEPDEVSAPPVAVRPGAGDSAPSPDSKRPASVPPAAGAGASAEPPASPVEADATPGKAKLKPRKYVSSVRADWVTYGLAALVLLLSIAGLFALMRAE